MRSYDVIIVGSGHAGCEAAAASANLGAKTLMIGMNLDGIAWMPCNPAVGGPAKSHLVKEIDALGGLMGLATDATYIQMKTLNSSRGAAVHSLRAQSDKYEYSAWMRNTLQQIPNLTMYQSMVTKILVENNKVIGVETSIGEQIGAKAVVITSGTFLQGKVFTGKKSKEAGRASEPSAIGLTRSLKELGFDFGRLKTGTPARIDSRTVDFSKLEEYPGDNELKHFSFLPNRPILKQLPCHATRTTEKTIQVIKDNLQESPMYSGLIEGVGPRYCPSIEDKIVRFVDKKSHLLFLEPEGRKTNEIYLQGCSTSLPIDVQWLIVQSLPGLEKAEIVRPAYAVEYDFLRPIQFQHSLQSKTLPGFFAAGQLLGTSGYEEAAAQGLVAGINAAKYALCLEAVVFSRSESYIGTLIDDLVIKEISEPYRMMTSRSEHRLYLRQDNADRRMTPFGREIGLVDDYRWNHFQEKLDKFNNCISKLKKIKIKSSDEANQVLEKYNQAPIKDKNVLSIYELLARPKMSFQLIQEISPEINLDDFSELEFELDTEIKYSGYVKKQESQVDNFSVLENRKIPEWFDYQKLQHISSEAREKLSKIKPQTVGQAARIDGVRQGDINVLLIGLAAR
ncbi:MAG: tRNA uridine-5-carboxymethylaminomethyl(34) synthesis enzyme MnmG [Candidatus Caenarcaniphilales bacterium]|nr:tRNA uridine-5-carboxymethylaminomethyl(34) synthesis enzyme MnmG [Candidatus Caenarcaniphilales bacterium]